MGHVSGRSHALAVLRLLARRASPVPAAAIARELEIPRSSLYRALAALQAEGFVVHVRDQGRYGLGLAAFELGTAFTRQQPLRWIARGPLERLVERTNEHAHFAMLHGRDVLYVIEERASGRPSLVTDVGVRLPANLTASGLAILAELPASQVRALFSSRAAFALRDGGGPASPSELSAILAKVRAARYAEEHGWVTSGFSSVAAAVRDHRGHPLGAVAVTFPTRQVDARRRRQIAEQACSAAAEISHATHAA